MMYVLRVIGIVTFIVLIFHTIFVLLDVKKDSSSILSSYQNINNNNNENQLSTEDIEHFARLYHLNMTLTLLNQDLRILNDSMHNHDHNQLMEIKNNHHHLRTATSASVQQLGSFSSSTQSSSSSSLSSSGKRYPKKKAVLFTMDSISSYEHAAHHGGAAGEIIIRKSLEDAFKYFNIQLELIRSDEEFESKSLRDYDIIILDPWTWAARGWVPKPNIRGLDHKIYIMDFFGSQKLRGSGLNIPPSRFLTAFGSPWNTFLGYYMKDIHTGNDQKLTQGVIWGKDMKHFDGRMDMIRVVSTIAPLVATVGGGHGGFGNVQWIGHQSPQEWKALLAHSKFLLGLGNPLLGPSAIDAIAHGCMYLNPIYDSPMRDVFTSQHPYAAETIGEPYVCSFHINNHEELKSCVNKAMNSDLISLIPKDFQRDVYFDRVAKIFNIQSL